MKEEPKFLDWGKIQKPMKTAKRTAVRKISSYDGKL
jgi:hypothetical protein